MKIKTGDAVLIEWTDEGGGFRRCEGTVILASANEQSLMLGFEAILRGCVGMCPVLRDDAGVYRSVIDGGPVTVKPVPLQ